ncbi:hypothetical protein Gotur_034837 [Gossypium turneri]
MRINKLIGPLQTFGMNLDESRKNISKGEKNTTLQVETPIATTSNVAIEEIQDDNDYSSNSDEEEEHVKKYIAFTTSVSNPVVTNIKANSECETKSKGDFLETYKMM